MSNATRGGPAIFILTICSQKHDETDRRKGVGGEAPCGQGSTSWPISSRRVAVTRRDSSEMRLASLTIRRRKCLTNIGGTLAYVCGALCGPVHNDIVIPLVHGSLRAAWKSRVVTTTRIGCRRHMAEKHGYGCLQNMVSTWQLAVMRPSEPGRPGFLD